MNSHSQNDDFMRQLDDLLVGRATDSGLPEADRRALEAARRLARANLSADSRRRTALRQDLLSKVTANAQRRKRRDFMNRQTGHIFQISAILVALFLAVVGVGWAIRNLLSQPEPVPAGQLNLPANLSVDEYAIKALPDVGEMDPFAFGPVNAGDIGLLDKHRAERDAAAQRLALNNVLLLPFGCQLEGQGSEYRLSCVERSLEVGQVFGFSDVSVNASGDNFLLQLELADGKYLLTHTLFEKADAFSYPPVFVGDDVLTVVSEDEVVLVKRAGQEIYRAEVGASGPIGHVRGLWAYGEHWALETAYVKNKTLADGSIDSQATGQVVIDGQLLNESLGYGETFGFALIDGRPFYFYGEAGRIGVSFDGQEIPLGYAEVPHYRCCSGSILNPGVSPKMAWFFARRGDQWHYVEIGVFGESNQPTPLPTAGATSDAETTAGYPSWQAYEAALVGAFLERYEDMQGQCEWEVWGRDTGVEYIWVMCAMTVGPIAPNMPAVVHISREGIITQVELAQEGVDFNPSVRQLFPADVQERIFAHPIPFDGKAAMRSLEQRYADPSIPPLIVLSGEFGASASSSSEDESLLIPTQEAPASSPGGVIAFVSERDGYPVLYLAYPASGEIIKLVDSLSQIANPAISPGGLYVAFQANSAENGVADIYRVEIDGSNLVNLSNSPEEEFYPAWSPDGSQIAYIVHGVTGQSSLSLISADGDAAGHEWMSMHGWASSLSWSLAGERNVKDQQLAFSVQDNGPADIYTTTGDGDGLVRLTANAASNGQPAWSPDGNKILFSSTEGDGLADLWLMSADGSGLINLTNTPNVNESHPAWSPDGAWIAFVSDEKSGQELYIMDVAGANRKPLLAVPGVDHSPTWGAALSFPSRLPPETADMDVQTREILSPLAMWAATVTIATPNEKSQVRDQVYQRVEVFSRHNVKWVLLDEWALLGLGDTTPVILGWSPDERWLYLVDSVHPDGCAVFSRGTHLRRIDLLDGNAYPPSPDIWGVTSFSRDQRTLAVVEKENIRLIDLETFDERTVPYQATAADWDSGNILWAPDGQSFAFTVINNPCGPVEQLSVSILRVDVASATVATLVESAARRLSLQAWYSPGRVWLVDAEGGFFWLDAASGQVTEAAEAEIAQDALLQFLDGLRTSQYSRASELYGGSYVLLIENNPSIDPRHHAALLQNLCTINGGMCALKLRSITFHEQAANGDFIFVVEFSNEDGSLFAFGPCCGADPTAEPPVSLFEFVVAQRDGRFQVMTLPPYGP